VPLFLEREEPLELIERFGVVRVEFEDLPKLLHRLGAHPEGLLVQARKPHTDDDPVFVALRDVETTIEEVAQVVPALPFFREGLERVDDRELCRVFIEDAHVRLDRALCVLERPRVEPRELLTQLDPPIAVELDLDRASQEIGYIGPALLRLSDPRQLMERVRI